MRQGIQILVLGLATCVGAGLVSACKRPAPPGEEAKAAPSATAKVPSARSAPSASVTAISVPIQTQFQIPSGPQFGVLPGRGLGPIRFGATLQTIERHMDGPCTEKSETLCRYIGQALDFHLKDGALVRVVVHGDERVFDESGAKTYGIFNGLLYGGASLGMYREFVLKEFGPPTRTEEVKPGRFQTLQRDYYDGIVLEYDRLANGNVVLAGIEITPSKSAKDNYLPKR